MLRGEILGKKNRQRGEAGNKVVASSCGRMREQISGFQLFFSSQGRVTTAPKGEERNVEEKILWRYKRAPAQYPFRGQCGMK